MSTLRQDFQLLDSARSKLLLASVAPYSFIGATHGNPVAQYVSAFDPQFLSDEVLEVIKQELMDQILAEMETDKRTRLLLEGIDGTPIKEKRHGEWKVVPKPTFGFEPGSKAPILILKHVVSESEIVLEVKLNHPLYVVFHWGVKAHRVPPFTGIHVYPTKAGIAANPTKNWNLTKFGLVDIREVPWSDPNNPKIKWARVTKNPIQAPSIPGNKFVTNSWRVVLKKNANRTARRISQRMARGR